MRQEGVYCVNNIHTNSILKAMAKSASAVITAPAGMIIRGK